MIVQLVSSMTFFVVSAESHVPVLLVSVYARI